MNKPAPLDTVNDRPPVATGSAPPAQDGDELNRVFQSVARYFSVLSEPTRLKILHTICDEEHSVSAIVKASGATQTNVSRHLAMMLQVGVVSRRRQGTSVFYKVIDPEFAAMCRAVCVRIASRIEAGEPLRRELLEFAAQR
jgi:DNA-binding transcriptional ArsR family regulator